MATKASAQPVRGHIRQRGNSFQVLVRAGTDPITGRELRLTESTTDERQAQAILKKLVRQVEDQRHARTRATFGAALEKWLQVHDIEASTLESYRIYARRYILPALGHVPIGDVKTQGLDELYAELRRCKARCRGQSGLIDHRMDGPHECRVVKHRRPPGRPPVGGYPEHDCSEAGCKIAACGPHVCKPLSAATIRRIHFVISGTMEKAIRWDWIAVNPAAKSDKPKTPPPQPEPPSQKDAARLVSRAWEQDAAWGTLVWLAVVTGLRRAELVGLQWSDVDFDAGMLAVKRNVIRVTGRSIEKSTKTHQMRRISLDLATVEILTAHRSAYEERVRQLGADASDSAYVFSYQADNLQPCSPSGISHRYSRMCRELGIDSHLHAVRHFSATELISAGVDIRTVAGRLGHGGGGSTTLRVYAAWVKESDMQAAELLASRFTRPKPRRRDEAANGA